MSARPLLTKTTGSLAALTVLALVAVAVTWSPPGTDADAAALAVRQQALVADIERQLDALVAAESFDDVKSARAALGHSVLAFDRGLEALVRGGTVEPAEGRPRRVRAVTNPEARRALSGASALWLQVGMPLADLAGGEFSVFSAAGQQAVAGLRENRAELTANLAAAAAACDGTAAGPGRDAMAARLLAGACLLALAGALALRRRALRPAREPDAERPAARGLAPEGAVSRFSAVADAPAPAEPAAAPAPRSAAPVPYKSPVDFEDVGAAVDQMTVDMSSIAQNSEKMRAAIDSVGVALQGMIYSLNELSDDTAEGYRVVRGANNAAGYTGQVAAELAESVREMGSVVSRVALLAQKCRQTATAIDQEAQQTGRTGAGFTAAVAGQVKALASRTNQSTAEIEHTVSQMLASTREYEEAVGQILKHVSAIHRVSQSLGEVVLDPPASAVVGPPRPRARVLEPAGEQPAAQAAPAPQPAPQAQAQPAPEPEPDEAPEPTPAEMADRTATAIEDAAAPAPAPAAAPSAPEAAPPEAADAEPAYDPESDDMPAYSKPKVTFSLDEHGADTPPPPDIPAPPEIPEADKPATSNSGRPNVFMLNRPQVPDEDGEGGEDVIAGSAIGADEPAAPAEASFEESLGAAAIGEEPAAAEAEPEAEPAAAPEPVPEATAPPEPEPEPETDEADADEPAVADGPKPNIFMLNDPTQTPKPRVGVS